MLGEQEQLLHYYIAGATVKPSRAEPSSQCTTTYNTTFSPQHTVAFVCQMAIAITDGSGCDVRFFDSFLADKSTEPITNCGKGSVSSRPFCALLLTGRRIIAAYNIHLLIQRSNSSEEKK